MNTGSLKSQRTLAILKGSFCTPQTISIDQLSLQEIYIDSMKFIRAKYVGNHKYVNRLNASIKGQSLSFFSFKYNLMYFTGKPGMLQSLRLQSVGLD